MTKTTPRKSMARPRQRRFWHDLFIHQLPRTHMVAAAGVATALTITLAILPSEKVEAKRQILTTDLSMAIEATDFKIEPATLLPEPILTEPAEPVAQVTWQDVTVKSGDSLSTLFKRAALGPRDVHEFVSSSSDAKQLRKVMPGETLSFGLDDSGDLCQLRYNKSQLESWHFEREEEGYTAERIVLEPKLIPTYREALITNSLFVAADKVGIPHGQIMELAGIFGWDIDFALDIRKGDSFAVLFEEKFLKGEQIGTGNILAAEFTNQGKTFRAVRYVDSKGRANYFTPEGLSMRKAFLRTPVDFARVSSGFNMRRLHPITKKIKPHRGIDYAASTGTPVYASGDGKVVRAGYTRANGNYVVVQHGQNYSTKYLHLHKRKVKKGQSVKQGQTIGTVGSTGLATGPHLHYEFLVNGVHRNPRTVKLPQALPIAKEEKTQFLAQTAPLMTNLARNQSQSQLAQAAATSNNEG